MLIAINAGDWIAGFPRTSLATCKNSRIVTSERVIHSICRCISFLSSPDPAIILPLSPEITLLGPYKSQLGLRESQLGIQTYASSANILLTMVLTKGDRSDWRDGIRKSGSRAPDLIRAELIPLCVGQRMLTVCRPGCKSLTHSPDYLHGMGINNNDKKGSERKGGAQSARATRPPSVSASASESESGAERSSRSREMTSSKLSPGFFRWLSSLHVSSVTRMCVSASLAILQCYMFHLYKSWAVEDVVNQGNHGLTGNTGNFNIRGTHGGK